HGNSRVNRRRNMRCYFCDKPYVTAIGVFHHLELCGCPKVPLDRMKLYDIVESRDLNGLITEKLLEWSGSGGFRATMKSWNASARAFECFLCGRHFKLRISLKKHIQLPQHQQ
ncbi:hypothetical protein F5883DRAFT_376233, partial [Diaporthe sp. PMI_573]